MRKLWYILEGANHMNERILIIEDDQQILKLLQRGLAYEGYTVDTATDGRMGLILARDHTPDLVILDWMLPGMDGLEVCHRLRTGGSIPILMADPGETPLTIVLQLRSAQFRFPDGDEQTVTLTEPNQIVSFTAAATSSGRSQILVVVRAPSGRKIQQQVLVVRTTAVSRIALLITVAAAIVLAALWARRYVRRPTTTTS